MTQSTAVATLNTLITASVSAYADSGGSTQGAEWIPLKFAPVGSNFANVMSQNGYSAQAYVNDQTGEVIIANRGTIDIEQNLASDGEIALIVPVGAQAVADDFAVAALQAAQAQLSSTGV